MALLVTVVFGDYVVFVSVASGCICVRVCFVSRVGVLSNWYLYRYRMNINLRFISWFIHSCIKKIKV